MTKHKHADLIHAWADGAEIQQCDHMTGEWFTCDPEWFENTEYRIKPSVCQNTTNEEKKPVVRWLWVVKVKGDYKPVDSFMSQDEADKYFTYRAAIKLEWSRTEFPE